MAAAGGTRQYTAIFAIGGKMLASFRGVMNAANARLAKLRASTLGFGKSILKLTGVISLLGAAVAGLGISEILGSLFHGATEQAKEARQRINATIASFLQLRDIQKKGGFDFAKDQLDVIMKQNEALGKQGVLHSDIYNEMTKQLAQGGVPPRQIQAAVGAMGDLLVKTRGVNASEAEGAELANAVVKAIHGKTKAMQAFGIFIDANKVDSAGKKIKKSYQEIYEEIVKIASSKGIAGFNIARAADPEGKIQILQNRLQDMREELGNKMLPVQAKIAEAWLAILTPDNVKLLTDAVGWLMGKLLDLVNYLKNDLLPYLKSTEGQKQLKKLGDMFVWVVKHAKPLALTIVGIVAALWAFQAATTAINLVVALANPVGLVILALVILATTIYLLITRWKEFVKIVDTVWKKLGEIPIIGPALQAILLPFKQFVHFFDWLVNLDWSVVGNAIKKVWDNFTKYISDKFDWLKTKWKGFLSWWKSNQAAGMAYAETLSTGQAGGPGGYGAAAASAAPTAAAQAAAAQMPLSAEGLKAVQADRASIIEEMKRPELRNLISATLATEAAGAEDQKNIAEALVNRATAQQHAGTYKGIESMIKGGFYGPYNRGETAAVMSKGLSDQRSTQVAGMLDEIGAGRNALGGLTDQGMINEIKGAIKEQHGEDFYGIQGLAGEQQTAAYKYSRGYAEGGIARRPQLATLAERGPELVVPQSQWGGIGGTNVSFSPNITINGDASEEAQKSLDMKLRNLAREFIENFKRAQYQERRLSYESGYG